MLANKPDLKIRTKQKKPKKTAGEDGARSWRLPAVTTEEDR